MSENYYALLLSILKNYTPERSFKLLNGEKVDKEHRRKEALDMVELKKAGYTYREIGDMFGVSKDVVYTRIRRATGRIK
ncbi:helix-turn-helix domain-containing protein [Clostridium sp. 19966]|uniref:helix-turn-helix domain-containing protein n=1 Tax=Clostridium sp. 19966 TaxID=2768166 RepID=UPI0028DE31D3|nr:helix-turn-helix domain-containing protein [Clostridium sp. 19966]MDT8718298.1 helix-turn-helix domain-containing protein [Clostridium sp. 19966]